MGELQRILRVSDMMTTAHSILRDRYSTLSTLFENSLLVASAVLNAFVFIDTQFIYNTVGIAQNIQQLVIGSLSILVFAISLVLLQVKWKEKAEEHKKAAKEFFLLKQECKNVCRLQDGTSRELAEKEFIEKYGQVSESLCKIPEKKFIALKLRHYRKIELSKLIDKHPGSRLLFLKVKLFLSSFREKNHNEF